MAIGNGLDGGKRSLYGDRVHDLLKNYYKTLKVVSKFKAPVGMTTSDHDYGLELAVRRRRTKSLQDEDVLRRKLVASFNYGEPMSADLPNPPQIKQEINVRMVHSTTADYEDIKAEMLGPTSSIADMPAERVRSDVGSYEDWFGSEIVVPRDTDRILEQFVIMMLRIGVYLNGADPIKLFSSHSRIAPKHDGLGCSNLANGTETPPLVGSHRRKVASYLQNYPQIFMKKPSTELLMIPPELTIMQEPQLERDRSQMMSTEQIYPMGTPSVVMMTSEETPSNMRSDSNKDVGIEDVNSDLNLQCVEKKESLLNFHNNTEYYNKDSFSINVKAPVITSSQSTTTAADKHTTNENKQDEKDENKPTVATQISLERFALPSEYSSTTSRAQSQTNNSTQSSSSLQKIIERMKRNLPQKHSLDEKNESK